MGDAEVLKAAGGAAADYLRSRGQFRRNLNHLAEFAAGEAALRAAANSVSVATHMLDDTAPRLLALALSQFELGYIVLGRALEYLNANESGEENVADPRS